MNAPTPPTRQTPQTQAVTSLRILTAWSHADDSPLDISVLQRSAAPNPREPRRAS